MGWVARIAAWLVVVLVLAEGRMEWMQVRDRAMRAGARHEVVNAKVKVEGDTVRVWMQVLGDSVDARFDLDRTLFHPEFEHHQAGRSGDYRVVEEELECMYKSPTHGYINLCAGTFSGVLSIPGRDAEIHVEHVRGDTTHLIRQSSAGDRADIEVLVYEYHPDMDDEWSCGAPDADHDGHLHLGDVARIEEGIAEQMGSLVAAHQSSAVPPMLRGRSLAGATKKIIKLVVVNDYRRTVALGDNVFAFSADVIQKVQNLLDKFNQKSYSQAGYMFEIQIIKMFSFKHGDPFTVTEAGGEVDYNILLSRFMEWREEMIASGSVSSHGLGTLLSGYNLKNNVVGFATVKTLCDDRAGASIVQANGDHTQQVVATTTAHEIFHNLGAFHTDKTLDGTLVRAPCTGSKYVMDPSGTNNGDWSECTINWLKMAFGGVDYSGYPVTYGTARAPACAEERSNLEWRLDPICGNGIVEEGEDCDCAGPDCPEDPCCDGQLCKLKAQATCSALEPCCDKSTCRPVTDTNFLCRDKEHAECGLAETCNGVDSFCPLDEHVPSGTTCEDGGACYAGACQSPSEQCERLLGRGYIWCDPPSFSGRDDRCGDLYCKLGSQGTCRVVKNMADGGQTNHLVEDGTPCAGRKTAPADKRWLCFQQECVPSQNVTLPISITCSNGRLDPGETDVDCGGPTCFSCLPNEKCLEDDDCASAPGKPGLCDKNATRPTSAPTFGSRVPIGGCSTQSAQSACSMFSGCVWLAEFGVCRDVGYYPPASGCSIDEPPGIGQDCCQQPDSEDTCINYSMCRWDESSQACTMKATNAPTPSRSDDEPEFGLCFDYSQNELGGEENPSLWDQFLQAMSENIVLVICVGGGALLLGVCLSFIICYRHCGQTPSGPNIKSVPRSYSTTSSASTSSLPATAQAVVVSSTTATSRSNVVPVPPPRPSSTPALPHTAPTPPVHIAQATPVPVSAPLTTAPAPAPAPSAPVRCPLCVVHPLVFKRYAEHGPANPTGLCATCSSKRMAMREEMQREREQLERRLSTASLDSVTSAVAQATSEASFSATGHAPSAPPIADVVTVAHTDDTETAIVAEPLIDDDDDYTHPSAPSMSRNAARGRRSSFRMNSGDSGHDASTRGSEISIRRHSSSGANSHNDMSNV